MIQIIGTKKNRATQHALRFFKERRITFQWRDLTEKGLSRSELENIRSRLKTLPLDREGKAFRAAVRPGESFDPLALALREPLVLELPIVRTKTQAASGMAPERWQEMAREEAK